MLVEGIDMHKLQAELLVLLLLDMYVFDMVRDFDCKFIRYNYAIV